MDSLDFIFFQITAQNAKDNVVGAGVEVYRNGFVREV